MSWNVKEVLAPLGARVKVMQDTQDIIDALVPMVKAQDHVLVMSNGGFDGLHQRLLNTLAQAEMVA